jgi:uncharacterized protein (DUF2235 family)
MFDAQRTDPRLIIPYSLKHEAASAVRNLVFCFDDAAAPYSTNLRKLAEILENFGKPDDGRKTRQIVYYQPDPTRAHSESPEDTPQPVFENGSVQSW